MTSLKRARSMDYRRSNEQIASESVNGLLASIKTLEDSHADNESVSFWLDDTELFLNTVSAFLDVFTNIADAGPSRTLSL